MSARAQAQPPTPQLTEANHFELRNGSVRLTYTANDLAGKPQLRYQDGQQVRTFTGDQIRQEETALGRLLSVPNVQVDVIAKITLVLPKVLVTLGTPEKLSTFVVFENEGPVARPPHPGPVETYSVKTLRGQASLILT